MTQLPVVFRNDVLARLPGQSDEYRTAAPFPHVVVDDLFDEALLQQVADAFPPASDARWNRYLTDHEDKLAISNSERDIPAPVVTMLRELNAERFLHHLGTLTGIQGLIPDPYLGGAGMHCVVRGGRLGIHADFNFHSYMLVARRVNLLVYVNRDWPEEYGGHLELWDAERRACVHRILPVFNRTVIFSTSRRSLHGHPRPLTCPADRVRKSIALYYYTAPDIEAYRHALVQHGTEFLSSAPPSGGG